AFYVSQSDPLSFTDEAIQQGIGEASRQSLTFGVFFFDYDLDGWLDLLTANGHLYEDIEKLQSTQRYRQRAQLFWNARGMNRDEEVTVIWPDGSKQKVDTVRLDALNVIQQSRERGVAEMSRP